MPRCLIISNRLPETFDESTQAFVASSGGLVSAIKGLDPLKIGCDLEWVGPLKDNVPEEKMNDLQRKSTFICHPIIVPSSVYDSYSQDFCSQVLWPLLHFERSKIQHSLDPWKNYQKMNHLMAEAILKIANSDDLIWVHDYHFFLVPEFIKSKRPDLKVGFFLHTPFPSVDIFRELPQRQEILASLHLCDLVGFHDLSYLAHFKGALSRFLGEEIKTFDEHKLSVYPISIDVDHFKRISSHCQTTFFKEEFSQKKQNRKWILGVDRLDYIKGILHKLYAFQDFLRKNPDLRLTVQMIQVIIPSRSEVKEYQDHKAQVEQLISSINGEFSTPTHVPIHYLHRSLSDHELSALYQSCDVLLVGSCRDGMNLVSLEYIASQNDQLPGGLLLSEFTGAHSSLSGAISINPWNIEETACKIKMVLEENIPERQKRTMPMKEFLNNHTSSDWASSFLNDLNQDQTSPCEKITLGDDGHFPWMKELKGKKILLISDFDGTLVPLASSPSDVLLQEETKNLLRCVDQQSNLQLIVLSGRGPESLENLLVQDDLHLALGACHGAYLYTPEIKEWSQPLAADFIKWKKRVMDLLTIYSARTPGSFLEDKGHAITWHYRNAPTEFAQFLANKLHLELEEAHKAYPIQVSLGKKTVEIKSLHANKGIFIRQWLRNQEYQPEVILAIGDDRTDEDMFDYLQNQSEIPHYCIKVGEGPSLAGHHIQEQNQVNQFLRNLTQCA
jgi:trehalose 6-phosphate synthase/phosphatase